MQNSAYLLDVKIRIFSRVSRLLVLTLCLGGVAIRCAAALKSRKIIQTSRWIDCLGATTREGASNFLPHHFSSTDDNFRSGHGRGFFLYSRGSYLQRRILTSSFNTKFPGQCSVVNSSRGRYFNTVSYKAETKVTCESGVRDALCKGSRRGHCLLVGETFLAPVMEKGAIRQALSIALSIILHY